MQAAPQNYVVHPWDEKELTDEQFPYKVKFENTDLLGNITIDPDAEPQDLTLMYNVTFAASDADYNGASVSISENGDLTKIAQALAMQPSQLTSNMLSAKTEPQEGKIAFAAVKPMVVWIIIRLLMGMGSGSIVLAIPLDGEVIMTVRSMWNMTRKTLVFLSDNIREN